MKFNMSDTEFLSLVERVSAFHGRKAPGVVIGVSMVHKAYEKLGSAKNLVAYVETCVCLPDVIQYLCGCTVGNGNLRFVEEIGRYAMSIFDKDTGRGVRVHVDLKKINNKETPELHNFFLNKQNDLQKNKVDAKTFEENVVKEFLAINMDIFGVMEVKAKNLLKPTLAPIAICTKCKEFFCTNEVNPDKCAHCKGELTYYE